MLIRTDAANCATLTEKELSQHCADVSCKHRNSTGKGGGSGGVAWRGVGCGLWGGEGEGGREEGGRGGGEEEEGREGKEGGGGSDGVY